MNITMKGQATLTLVNSDGSIAKEITVKNKIYSASLINMVMHKTTFAPLYYADIRLYNETIDGDVYLPDLATHFKSADRISINRETNYNTNGECYIESFYEFPSDGSSHNISGISIADTTSLTIDPVFVQSPTQLLQIAYRIIFDMSNASVREEKEFKRYLLKAGENGDITAIEWSTTSVFPFSYKMYGPYTAPTGADLTLDKIDNVNSRINLVHAGRNLTTTIIDETTPGDIYPLGPLLNHRSTSQVWYEEVNALATGKGYPSIAAGNYNWNLGTAYMPVINITKEGNVGVAEFIVNHVDVGGSFQTECGTPNSTTFTGTSFDVPDSIHVHADYQYPIEFNPLTNLRNAFVYSLSEIVIATQTAVGILNVETEEYHQADFTHGYPALPSMPEVTQVSRNAAGDIFIATGSGIIKVEGIKTAPIVSVLDSTVTLSKTILVLDITADDKLVGYTNTNEIIISTDGTGSAWNVLNIPNLPTSYRSLAANAKFTNEVVMQDSGGKLWWIDLDALTCVEGLVRGNTGRIERVLSEPKNGLWIINGQIGSSRIVPTIFISRFAETEKVTIDDSVLPRGYTSSNSYLNSMPFVYDALGNLLVLTPKGMLGTSGMAYGESLPWVVLCKTNMSEGLRFKVINSDEDYQDKRTPRYINTYSGSITTSVPVISNLYRLGVGDECIRVNRNGSLGHSKEGVNRNFIGVNNWKYWTGTEWSNELHKVAVSAGSDGSLELTRVNCEFNTNKLEGSSCFNISEALAKDYSANGLTVAFDYVAMEKLRLLNNAIEDTTVRHPLDGESCLFSLRDNDNNTGFAVFWNDYAFNYKIESYGNTGLKTTTLGASSTSGTHRVAITLSSDGTLVVLHVDGVEIGSSVLQEPVVTNMLGRSITANIAGETWNHNLGVPQLLKLLAGDVTNIQIWEKAFTAQDVTDDYSADPHILADTASMIAKWDMDTSDYGESTLTSTNALELESGLALSFLEGDLSSVSFTADDYYNMAVCKHGMLKSNTETIDIGIYISGSLEQLNNSHLYDLDGNVANTVPNAGVVRKPVFIRNYSKSNTFRCNASSGVSTLYCETLEGNATPFDFEFTINALPSVGSGPSYIGAFKDGNTYSLYETSKYGGVQLEEDGSIVLKCTDSNDLLVSPAGSIALGDTYKLSYDGTKVELFKYDGNAFSSLGSVVQGQFPETPNITVGRTSSDSAYSIRDAFITTATPPILVLGNRDQKTGIYSETAKAIVYIAESNITIDGIAAERIETDQALYNQGGKSNRSLTTGQVGVKEFTDAIVFSSADAGKPVSIDHIYVAK